MGMSTRELTIDNARLEGPQDPQEEIDRVKKPKDEGQFEQSGLRNEEIHERDKREGRIHQSGGQPAPAGPIISIETRSDDIAHVQKHHQRAHEPDDEYLVATQSEEREW